tara:strand:+ start:501 stop:2339 length:1839 start_codon:yes stop_codon:yes gene_type:complete
MWRTMKRLNAKKLAKKNRVYYWDIESWGLNPRNVAFIIVKPERKYARHTPEEWLFATHEDMRAWIDALPSTYNHIFYAHNSHKFDTLAIYTAEEIIDSPKCMAGGTIYTLQPRKNLEFRDSMHILSAPLAAYGAKGLTPAKFTDEDNPDFGNPLSITDEDLDYCRLDVDILRDSIITMREAYRDWVGKEDADLPLTAASLAYRVWSAKSWPEEWSFVGKSGKRYYSVTFPNQANEAAKFAYYGGKVQVFEGFDGVLVLGVMSIDRNSMFPAEMKDKKFPNPNKVYQRAPTVHGLLSAKEKGWCYWGHVVMKAGPDAELFLPTIIDKKADYNQTTYDGYLMFPEINYALEHGWVLEGVKELWVSPPCNHFSSHVGYFYEQRMRLKAAGDPRQQFIKIGPLNSLYGKFGQKDRCARIEDKEGIEKIMEVENWQNDYEVHFWSAESSKFYLTELEPSSISKNTFFPWAASVTSYARIELQRAIMACRNAGLDVVYCDTDSVHVCGLESLDEIPLTIGKELGEWGFEFAKGHKGIIPSAIYWERKAYVWFNEKGEKLKIKHKGVSESDGDLTKEQVNISVIQPRTAMRRGIQSGYENVVPKRSSRYYRFTEELEAR